MAADDGNTRVRYGSLQEMANRIRHVSGNIKKDLDEMEQAIKVVTDTWDGEAHQEYLTLQKKYRARADHMHSRLEQVAKLIESGKDGYRSTDVKASRLFTEAF
ncbi:WXG100 family type VII secretion target [Streptomyces sp. MUM 178J]|uniref:WXG100 family type VII secretion target n=1 Tax=Streptomyces sp. MUM 178J TaxID=2791991 RepID=UPI001F04994F|nr:WXG100 family type VII secretion target [Streptomyces sp. MUM 178J]WRQ80924.1 WXG100 family type VII secretion target [Streptomyces sp. MUM 178J]